MGLQIHAGLMDGCRQVQAYTGKGGVRLIGWAWVIYLVGLCAYTRKSRDRCGWVWARLGMYSRLWAKVTRTSKGRVATIGKRCN